MDINLKYVDGGPVTMETFKALGSALAVVQAAQAYRDTPPGDSIRGLDRLYAALSEYEACVGGQPTIH